MSVDPTNIFRTDSQSSKSAVSLSSQADIPIEMSINGNNTNAGLTKRLYSSTDSVVSCRSSSSKQHQSFSGNLSSSCWLVVNNPIRGDFSHHYDGDGNEVNDPSQYKVRISVVDNGRGISKVISEMHFYVNSF